MALENRWTLTEMCSKKSHVSRNRHGKGAFRPDVIAYLEAALASDIAVYNCARGAHEEQTAAHGANFSAALRLFRSEAFQQRCDSIAAAAHKRSVAERRAPLLAAAAAERHQWQGRHRAAAATAPALSSSQVVAMLDGMMEGSSSWSSSSAPHRTWGP